MKDRVCTSCSFVGKPTKQCLESFLVDVFIWGTFGSIALITGLLPLLFFPVAWTIYHLIKFNSSKCPSCGDLEMVHMKSRKGRNALDKDAGSVLVWTSNEVVQH